ncbi:MAG: sulfur carrier protein ThiS adenylyltransferase ThiF [Sporomusaceae bacterium]|nr:sulfur carrier protein ThiS adenylyltransferase ThiF [Sporomusaceae bacterium]
MTENSRNLFEEALCNAFGDENLRKIQQAKIGIAGAGGLGSNCAVNLVRSGFLHFVIVDFDVIDFSNLNRQFYFYNQVGRPKVEALRENLLTINPNVRIDILQQKIEEHNVEAIFQECDIIVEAFDKACYKRMIVEHYINSDRLLVSASGIAGWSNSDDIKIHVIKEKFYLVGDLSSEVGKDLPPCAPRVSIAAAKQADIILSHVLKGD